jgi:transcriptional regulator with XRE-family HTH domain
VCEKPDSRRYSQFSALPARLKHWREDKGIKVSAAARELGVASSTWTHWETGRRFPSASLLLGLIEYTGVPLVELICENSAKCPFRKRQPN